MYYYFIVDFLRVWAFSFFCLIFFCTTLQATRCKSTIFSVAVWSLFQNNNLVDFFFLSFAKKITFWSFTANWCLYFFLSLPFPPDTWKKFVIFLHLHWSWFFIGNSFSIEKKDVLFFFSTHKNNKLRDWCFMQSRCSGKNVEIHWNSPSFNLFSLWA